MMQSSSPRSAREFQKRGDETILEAESSSERKKRKKRESQNGAASDSGACSEEAASGSDSLRSSLRTTSARTDHDVIFEVFDFLPLPFGCS
jgi:hypothetical protein